MKKIKLLATVFVLGQIATLFHKDKTFKKEINEAEGFDKIKYLFHSLVDLNKKIFFDIKNYDYDTKIDELQTYFEAEKEKIEAKIEELTSKASKLNKDKIQPKIQEIEKKANELKKMVLENVDYLNDKYDLQTKAEYLITKVKTLKK